MLTTERLATEETRRKPNVKPVSSNKIFSPLTPVEASSPEFRIREPQNYLDDRDAVQISINENFHGVPPNAGEDDDETDEEEEV